MLVRQEFTPDVISAANEYGICICGPSGSGKSTLIERLVREVKVPINIIKPVACFINEKQNDREEEYNGENKKIICSVDEFNSRANEGEFYFISEYRYGKYGYELKQIVNACNRKEYFLLETRSMGMMILKNYFNNILVVSLMCSPGTAYRRIKNRKGLTNWELELRLDRLPLDIAMNRSFGDIQLFQGDERWLEFRTDKEWSNSERIISIISRCLK